MLRAHLPSATAGQGGGDSDAPPAPAPDVQVLATRPLLWSSLLTCVRPDPAWTAGRRQDWPGVRQRALAALRVRLGRLLDELKLEVYGGEVSRCLLTSRLNCPRCGPGTALAHLPGAASAGPTAFVVTEWCSRAVHQDYLASASEQ
jgi:hypothetical protein